nr:lyase family protein [Actinomycetota bacterium]
MIGRYTLAEIGEVFTDRSRMEAWLEVEILTVEALAALGRIPAADAAFVRANRPVVDDEFVAAVEERERTTNHDLAAFVDVVQARVGKPAGNWVHYGLTSSDVVDTALSLLLRRAGKAILCELAGAIEAVGIRAAEFRN